MTDAEFARAVERGEIPSADFNHRSHLRLAWVYLSAAASTEEAAVRMAGELRKFAIRAGKPDKYSDAVTRFWMSELAAARRAMPGSAFDEVMQAHPRLFDKGRSDQQT